jgi:hypothetical protein
MNKCNAVLLLYIEYCMYCFKPLDWVVVYSLDVSFSEPGMCKKEITRFCQQPASTPPILHYWEEENFQEEAPCHNTSFLCQWIHHRVQ